MPSEQKLAPLRLNLGCGRVPLLFWTNLDANPIKPADIHADALGYLQSCADESYVDIYAGHLIEHLHRPDALTLLRECYRVLRSGGRLGVMVPDTREIMHRYVEGTTDLVEFPARRYWPVADLDAVCALFLYSTAQDSAHLWSYDERTLTRLLREAGFAGDLEPINRYEDPRVPVGAWYQCGFDARKP